MLASPVARQMAREHGIDLASVRGSGPDGRIERKDVQALIDAATARQNRQCRQLGVTETASAIVPVEAVQPPARMRSRAPRHRQVIAQRLTRSVQTIPQITLMATVDMTRARALLDAQRTAGLDRLTTHT